MKDTQRAFEFLCLFSLLYFSSMTDVITSVRRAIDFGENYCISHPFENKK